MVFHSPRLRALCLATLFACGGDAASPSMRDPVDLPAPDGNERARPDKPAPSPDPAPGPTAAVDAGSPPRAALRAVDLLFVIDNSLSMGLEQARLSTQLPRLLRVLTSGDRRPELPADPGDQARYFAPIPSLHVGVVTTELGVMRAPLSLWARSAKLDQCLDDAGSDDGVLQTSTTVAREGVTFNVGGETLHVAPNAACDAVERPAGHLAFDATGESGAEQTDAVADMGLALGCIAPVGVQGCAFEQQLEAMLKALAPSSRADFIGTSSRGRGAPDGTNRAFLRDEAVLAIVHLTDEDDCSIRPGGRVLFETQYVGSDTSADPWRRVPLNLRCGQAAEQADTGLLQPVNRYVEGLRELKRDPERVLFTSIVGIPEELEDAASAGRYDEVLAHPSMQFGPDPSAPELPNPSCSEHAEAGSPGVAYPARRFVEVAAGLGPVQASLFSICRDDFGPPLQDLVERVVATLSEP